MASLNVHHARSHASLASTSSSMFGASPPNTRPSVNARLHRQRASTNKQAAHQFLCSLDRYESKPLGLSASRSAYGTNTLSPGCPSRQAASYQIGLGIAFIISLRLYNKPTHHISSSRHRFRLSHLRSSAKNSDDLPPQEHLTANHSNSVAVSLYQYIVQAPRNWAYRWVRKVTPKWVLRFAGSHDMQELMGLVLPAFGAIFADPLMSLIDTAAVGQVDSVQLAAMGPNTAIFNFLCQLFGFLSIGTTSEVARASAKGDPKLLQRSISNALTIAVTLGLATTAILQLFAPFLLSSMGAGPQLVAAGESYLRIRGLAVPVVLVCMVCQGTFLGRQDARTPLLIFLAAGLVNIVLDLYLVLPFGMNMGVTGAAIATLAAQIVAATCFVTALYRKDLLPSRWSPPSLNEISPFLNSSGMLLLGSLCRMGVYTMMTISATKNGVIAVAAHQIGLQIFWFLTYFIDPLFVAATSFIARDIKDKPVNAMRMAMLLLFLSSLVGCFLAVVSTSVALTSTRVFTTDAAIIAAIVKIAPLMGVSQLLSSLVFVAEGILIGAGDLGYLTWIHCMNFIILGLYLVVSQMLGLGLTGIWFAILLNQIFRLIQHSIRVRSRSSPFPVHLLRKG